MSVAMQRASSPSAIPAADYAGSVRATMSDGFEEQQ